MALRKVHWPGEGKAVCGYTTDRLALNAQEVSCERCKKILPEVTRTAWDLILDEDHSPPVVKPKRVRKAPAPKAPPEIIIRRAPGVNRRPPPTPLPLEEWQDPGQWNPWSPWRGIAIGSVAILALLTWTLFTSIWSWLK